VCRVRTPGPSWLATVAATAGSCRGEAWGLPMAQRAIAWTLQNSGVSSAIIGASRPEQVMENTAAAGIRLDASTLTQIDELLDDLVDRDPAQTAHLMEVNPMWTPRAAWEAA
jgi:aryl-alcohol dehydrogenase-like predicted oxidoreductase